DQLQDVGPDWWLAIRAEILPLSGALAPDLARRLLKRHLLNLLISDLIRQTGAALDRADLRSADEVRRYPGALPVVSNEVLALRHSLHEFLTAYLYRQHHVETMWVKARRLITDLFTSLDQSPGQLPPEARSRIDRDEPRRRVICDYIAEMTDRQAVREHRRLFQFDMQVLP
ncbi:MAG: hypothetical protein ACRDGS_07355, partial [Chloroflexota bacterium]